MVRHGGGGFYYPQPTAPLFSLGKHPFAQTHLAYRERERLTQDAGPQGPQGLQGGVDHHVDPPDLGGLFPAVVS